MTLENIMLSETNQSQKDKCCMIAQIKTIYNSQTYGYRGYTHGYKGLVGRENGELLNE
jgi:hypothetical protein